MMQGNRMMAALAALLGLVALAGCSRKVDFAGHGAYPSPVRYPDPLVIVVPDDLDTLEHEVKIGGWLLPRKFKVYYGQALRHEAQARFSGMFSEVAIVDESTYAEITGTPLPGTEKPATEEQEAEKPGKDKKAKKGEEKADEDKEAKEGETDEFHLEFLPDFVRDKRGYLLHVRDPRYRFDQARSLVLMDVEFSDRFLDQVLTEGRLRGRGANVSPREADALIISGLRESAATAFSEALRRLRDQMIASIEDPSAFTGAAPPEMEPVATGTE